MPKILLADDSDFMRLFLKRMLTPHGLEVVGEAANGDEAVEQYLALQPDIMLLDLTMPGKPGLEALKILMEKQPSAKVIVVSAMSQDVFVSSAIASGAKAFVNKPVRENVLLQAIQMVLGTKLAE